MTIAAPGTNNARITTVEGAKQIFKTLKEYGVEELDVARGYGDGTSESYLRDSGAADGSFQIATKVAPPFHKPADLREKFTTCLKELGRDNVDILYLHAPQRDVPFKDSCEEMNKLHKEGKFKIFGVSNYRSWEVAHMVEVCRANGWIQPTLYQLMLNPLARDAEPELFSCCKHYGIDIVFYNPLAGGLLTGRYKSMEVPSEGRFSDAPGQRAGTMYRNRYWNPRYFQALAEIEPVLEKEGISMVEAALRWAKHHSGLNVSQGATTGDGIIIGASSDEQLRQNLDALAKGPLPQTVLDAYDRAWLIVKPVAPTYWR